jgi:hypothetical protein
VAIVGRFRDLPGAEVASATLDAAGIENELADVCTIGLVWTYSTALGWIRLNVRDVDLVAAREALDTPESIEWPVEGEIDDAPDRCLLCHSLDLEVVRGARKTLALMLLVPIPLWVWRSRVRCRTCGTSQRVPFCIRSELIGVWLITAVGTYVLTAVIFLTLGFIIRGRR